MFQADSLFPWKTVLGNVMMGPILLGTSKIAGRPSSLSTGCAGSVLSGFEDRYPHQLSGGMRKRVSMAAALINRPTILLMDEPFGALDVQTKAIMQTELLELWEELRPSVLFITHDLDEAVDPLRPGRHHDQQPGHRQETSSISTCRGPRGDVQAIRHEPRFLELQDQIWESLKDEVTRPTRGRQVAA